MHDLSYQRGGFKLSEGDEPLAATLMHRLAQAIRIVFRSDRRVL